MQSSFQLSFGTMKDISLLNCSFFLTILANISVSYCVSVVAPEMKRKELENYIASGKLRKIQMPWSTEIIHQDQIMNLAQSSSRLDKENVIFDTFKLIPWM